jgi:hypothetical protein
VASNEAARSTSALAPMSRRQISAAYRFLSTHQAAVLEAVTRHLIPGPAVGARELDHSGTKVVAYVDQLLSRFDGQTSARRVRVADLRDHYGKGIALLDELAGGDFTAVPLLQQGLIVSHARVTPFASALFDQIVEAIYAPPEMLRHNAADRYHETG